MPRLLSLPFQGSGHACAWSRTNSPPASTASSGPKNAPGVKAPSLPSPHAKLGGYPCRRLGKRVLVLQASALILVHNRPSGDPTPSKADIAVTRDIVKAAQPLGVTVHDHLIIGRGRHTRLRDLGLI